MFPDSQYSPALGLQASGLLNITFKPGTFYLPGLVSMPVIAVIFDNQIQFAQEDVSFPTSRTNVYFAVV